MTAKAKFSGPLCPVVELPPLKGKPGKERYAGPVKPIKGKY